MFFTIAVTTLVGIVKVYAPDRVVSAGSSAEVVAKNSKSSLDINKTISSRVSDFSVMLEKLKDSVIQIHDNSKEALNLNNNGNKNII